MISIVIPAHNESAVIGRCLSALLDGADPSGLEIVVVCNGCTDDTAAVARSFGPCVRTIETEVPSKSNALNLGDAAATGFPRVYLDADVVLPRTSLRRVVEELEAGRALAAAPRMAVDLSDRPLRVRAFYDVWLRLPYCRTGMIGSGVYAVSAEGRRRFDRFPAITADDAFVRLQFAPHERLTLTDCTFIITPPKTLARIVDIKTRAHFGNEELRKAFPYLWRNEETNHSSALFCLALNPLRWPALAVYAYAKLATRRRTRARFRDGEIHKWERDESSRESAARQAS